MPERPAITPSNSPSDHKIELKTVAIDSLKRFDRNPRIHPDSAIQKLMKSIEGFGWTNPILVNKDGTVLAGHARLKAAEAMNITEVPAVILNIPDHLVAAYVIADNRLQDETDWDMPVLKDLLGDLDTGDFDMDLTGFLANELETLMTSVHQGGGLTDDDEVPEVKEPICKRGDLWLLGDHRLLCGDATLSGDVERLMAGEKADMMFTDPPYSVGIGKKNRALQSVQKAGRILTDIEGDNLSVKETAEKIWQPVFALAEKQLSDGAAYYVTAPQGGDHMMMMMMMSGSIPCRHELIWIKNQPTFSMGRLDYAYQHEPILYGWKGNHKFVGEGQHQRSIWEIDRERSCNDHPTTKPVALPENAILNSSQAAAIVLDPFLGSGTTIIAAEKTGRKCYGLEIDLHYCSVIIKRWEDYTGRKAERG